MAKGSVNISGMSEEDIERCISAHDAAKDSHPDIRRELIALRNELNRLKLRLDTNISENVFSVDFATLDDAAVTGVWNTSMARIEF